MFTLEEARAYLLKARKIAVTRQALHLLVQRNPTKCEKLGSKARAALWRIPQSLLDTYAPDVTNKELGHRPKTKVTKKAA